MAAEFWNKIAANYAATPVKDMDAYEATLERTRSYLSTKDHVLEVGCGTGTTALKLSHGVERIMATDLSEEMLNIARNKSEAQNTSNVTFRQATIMDQHPEAPFDAAMAFSILHLVDDLPATLTHLHSQIKPGGYLISKTACLMEMSVFIRLAIRPMQWIGKAPHVLMFSSEELQRQFRRAGFEVVETGYFGTNTSARFVVGRKPE